MRNPPSIYHPPRRLILTGRLWFMHLQPSIDRLRRLPYVRIIIDLCSQMPIVYTTAENYRIHLDPAPVVILGALRTFNFIKVLLRVLYHVQRMVQGMQYDLSPPHFLWTSTFKFAGECPFRYPPIDKHCQYPIVVALVNASWRCALSTLNGL